MATLSAHERQPPNPPEGWWWACERPEAPPVDRFTIFDTDGGCRGCLLMLEALVRQGDRGRLHDNGRFSTPAEALAEARSAADAT